MNNNFAFIDGQNLHFGIKSLGWKLDHKKFRAFLEEEMNVTRAYIFLGFMEEHQDLYNVLQDAGFICHFKPLVRYDDGTIKGNVDADMVLQVMVEYDNYDQAVIVSGDGDFSGLLRHLASKNKIAQMIIPNRNKYSSLFDRVDGFDEKHVTYMNDLRAKLNYQSGFKKPRIVKQQPTKDTETQKETKSKDMDKPQQRSEPAKSPQQKRTPRPNNNSRPTQKPAPKRAETAKNPTSAKSKPAKRFKSKSDLEKSLLEAIDNV